MTLLEKYNEKCKKERSEYEVLDYYKDEIKNYLLKIRNIHNGQVDWIGYGALFHHKNNPRSMSKRKEVDKEEFIKRVEDKFGDRSYTIHTFKSLEDICLITCHKCDRTFHYIARNFLNRGCGKCRKLNTMKRRTKSDEDFKNEVYNLVGDEYIFLDTYINAHTKLNIKHTICGNIWKTAPHTFTSTGVRCPECSSSKGEKEISKYLNKYNFKFKKEYQFKDCKYERNLRFDFGVYKNNTNILLCLIEFHGKQHYEPREFGGMSKEDSILEFDELVIKDNIKREYCVANNIKLIEIPYWEFKDIPNIIDKMYSELHGDM